MRTIWAVVLLTLLAPLGVVGQRVDKPAEVANPDCANAQTQAELNYCASQNFAKADKDLNTVYKQLMGTLKPDEKALVVRAQRQWLTYRDAHCQLYEKRYAGGSMRPMMVLGCKEAATRDRIKELKTILEEAN